MYKFVYLITGLLISLGSPMIEAKNKTECHNATVTGHMTTTNVTPLLQVGTIKLTVSDDTDQLFEEDGVIVGRILSDFPIFTLEHNLLFEDGSRINTENDEVQEIEPYACSDGSGRHAVIEVISTIGWSSKFFRGATTTGITATGCMSTELGGENEFIIEGSVCVK